MYKVVKKRKSTRCKMCGELIEKGDHALTEKLKVRNRWSSNSYCKDCAIELVPVSKKGFLEKEGPSDVPDPDAQWFDGGTI